jgi:hypothetical protein
MRIGQNPAKMRGSPAYTPQRVGLASLTYVPALEGYFRQAREVIDIHLTSLRASLDQECDLCVFDNGSCPDILSFLQDRWRTGVIDWLFLSHHNLGKNGALNWIFSSMPNEYIGYSDSDVLFRKGWLEESLEIFESFERAGMVSAQPVFFDFLRGQGQTAKTIAGYDSDTGVKLSIEQVQPPAEVVEEYCYGINASPEIRQQFRQAKLTVAVNHSRGTRAVTSATDMQFMLSRTVARKLVPMPIAGALTARDAIEIPLGVEALGYWILSTEEPLVRHLGNTIQGQKILEIERLSVSGYKGGDGELPKVQAAAQYSQPKQRSTSISWKKSTLAALQRSIDRSPRLRRTATRLYDWLFSLLYEERL